MHTTLNAIRAHRPCASGWERLLRHLGKTGADDEPLPILTILDSNGLDDALWCLRAVEGHDREIRMLAVRYAREVQHLMTDPRSIAALDVAERYARGEATDGDLAAAAEAAWAVAAEARAVALSAVAEARAAALSAVAAAAVAAWAVAAVALSAWAEARAAAWTAVAAAAVAAWAVVAEAEMGATQERLLREMLAASSDPAC